VDDTGLGGELGVEDDRQPQVPELRGKLWRRARFQRVIHLVGLLEEVLAQRCVRLLAVPRTAIRAAQAGRDSGHRPGAGGGKRRREGGEVERVAEGSWVRVRG